MYLLKKPIKYLSFGLSNKAGKNNLGKRVVLSKGGGRNKRRYRIINFYNINYDIPYILLRIEYDPNRSSKIALICYKNGFLSYILLIEGLSINNIINPSYSKLGLSKQLKDINHGSLISSVEFFPNCGSKIARSAGTFCILVNRYNMNKLLIRLPSGEERLFGSNIRAILGIISNKEHKLKKRKKASCSIRKGIKPKVRGVAKNAVDHPNGGGRGKSSKWSECPNFTRKVLKGVKTKKFYNKNIIVKKSINKFI